MTKILSVFLLVVASFGPVFGQTTKTAAEAVKQLERDWTEAMKAHDIDRLSQIIADDWSGLGYDGAKSTKKEAIVTAALLAALPEPHNSTAFRKRRQCESFHLLHLYRWSSKS